MKTKREIRYFSILDHEKEQAYLQDMHRAGWKFTGVTGLCVYHFEACEPEDVVYQLDYNREGQAHHAEYVQMFTDCGWEYLQDYVGYSYFRKPVARMQGPEEIFCDDESRLQMLQRVFLGRMIPLVILFSLVLVPQFFRYVFWEPDYGIAVVLGVFIALYLAIFAGFAAKYFQYRSSVRK